MSTQSVEIDASTLNPQRGWGRPGEPGNNANPGGRPNYTSISEAYRRLLQNGGAEKLAAVIFNDALTARRAQDRRAAAAEITDRVEGKAIQAVRLEQTLDAGSVRAIADMAAMFAPSVIDLPGANRPLIAPPEETEPNK